MRYSRSTSARASGSRSRISTRSVSGSVRETEASATQGEARRRALRASMSRPRMFSPTAGPSSSRTSPSERKWLPRTSTRPTRKRSLAMTRE